MCTLPKSHDFVVNFIENINTTNVNLINIMLVVRIKAWFVDVLTVKLSRNVFQALYVRYYFELGQIYSIFANMVYGGR